MRGTFLQILGHCIAKTLLNVQFMNVYCPGMTKDLITFGLGQPGPKRYQRTIQPNKPSDFGAKKAKTTLSSPLPPNLKISLALKTLIPRKFRKN